MAKLKEQKQLKNWRINASNSKGRSGSTAHLKSWSRKSRNTELIPLTSSQGTASTITK